MEQFLGGGELGAGCFWPLQDISEDISHKIKSTILTILYYTSK